MLKGTLLIVDDERDIVERLKLILEEHADIVLTASNGLEALDLVRENEVHCILSDINMPRMNGVEFIRTLRADGLKTPFVFYTAHGSSELLQEAMKYRAFDFLNKPNLEGLESVISQGLNKGVARDEQILSEDQTFVSEYQRMLSDVEGA